MPSNKLLQKKWILLHRSIDDLDFEERGTGPRLLRLLRIDRLGHFGRLGQSASVVRKKMIKMNHSSLSLSYPEEDEKENEEKEDL